MDNEPKTQNTENNGNASNIGNTGNTDNYMVSVDFGGRQLPIWKFEELYYVTFSPKILKEIFDELFDYPNLIPDRNWVSGGTPDIAVSAATYNSTLEMIERIENSTRRSLEKIKSIAEKAETQAELARNSGPFYDGHIAGGYFGHHNR